MRLEFKGKAHGMCINQYLNNLLKQVNESAENDELYFVKYWHGYKIIAYRMCRVETLAVSPFILDYVNGEQQWWRLEILLRNAAAYLGIPMEDEEQ